MAGPQGQVEVRETPDLVIGGARRVCVPRPARSSKGRGADESGAGDGDGVAGGPGLGLYRAGIGNTVQE